MDDVLSGDALAPYRVPKPTTCWWCGSSGPLTHEHKFKRRDLSRMGTAADLVWGSDRIRKIRSISKSNGVRFTESLCAPCNNTASQPFDYAYDTFSDFIWGNENLWATGHIDWWDVYGNSWGSSALNLARYAVKHMGCRMIHDGYDVPSSFATFLNGAPTIADVKLWLVKSSAHHDLYLMGVRDGQDTLGVWNSPAEGTASRSLQCLTGYWSATIIGFIGIAFSWEQGRSGADSFHTRRVAPLRLF